MLYNAAVQLYVMLLKAFACGWNAEHRLEELKKEIPEATKDLIALNCLIGEAESDPGRFFATCVASRSEAFCQRTFDKVVVNLKKDRQVTKARLEALFRERRWIMKFNRAMLAQQGGDARHLAH